MDTYNKTLAFIAFQTLSVTIDKTSICSGSAVWKSFSIKPAASRKCAKTMPIIIKREIVEFRNAGININTKTEPDKNAPVRTRSHCRKFI